MTVKELIQRLAQFDPKDQVIISYPIGGVAAVINERDITHEKGSVYLIKEPDKNHYTPYTEEAEAPREQKPKDTLF